MGERGSEEPRRVSQQQLRRQIREEARQERELRGSILRTLIGYLGFAELMAVLMVVATAFTAIATWRTATIAQDLLLTSERPYFGVHSVTLDNSRSSDPRVYVDYRNFGHVPADGVRIEVAMYVDGARLPVSSLKRDAGIMSPDVAHHVFLHLPDGHYADVIAGRSKLITRISAWYKDSGRNLFCYSERFAYEPDSGTFEIVGGSSRCDSPPPS